MLTILDHLPSGLLDARAVDLVEVLSGPTLIHLPGAGRRPLFVSTLLHGNETTGWEALRELLGRYRGRRLPRPLTIFIGNVQAAQARLRHLDGQPDFNRIWALGEGPEQAMAHRVLDEIRALQPVACLDIHNTSGNNPLYACVHRLDDESLQLARAFSSTSVYVTHPQGLLGVACATLATALTLECGKPGCRDVEQKVCEFLGDCLEFESLANLAASGPDSQLLRPVATVRVPAGISFGFDNQPHSADVDLCFRSDLDEYNFTTLPGGTAIARIRPGTGTRLQVFNTQGEDVSAHYFRAENDALITASELTPSLLTHNSRIIRQDCLCYLMEKIAAIPEGSPRAGPRQCPICHVSMLSHVTSWAWRCPQCALQAATHPETQIPTGWNEASAEAMTCLRTDNAQRLMQNLNARTSVQGKRLLDIGCAAGWFLKVARGYGLDTVGIEPDTAMAELARQDGLAVRNGWFPQALEAGEQFDFVTFNDVFEHLPCPQDALSEVVNCLPAGGYLLLNLPCASGVLYRVATMLARLGYTGPFERLWQCGFESPHRYYFDHDNLRTLVESHGFRLLGRVRIEALAVRGLWARINETGALSPIMAAFIWFAIVVSRPATRFMLPNDIMVHIYERCRGS